MSDIEDRMPNCEDCIHWEACKAMAYAWRKIEGTHYPLNAEKCEFFKERSKFIEQKTGEWIRHKPDAETMRSFHMAGIGKAMGENSIFWTCSICGGWGNLSQKYCSNCGAKMKKVKEAIKERGKDEIETSN